MSFDEGEGRYCVELDASRDQTSTSPVGNEASSSFIRDAVASRDAGASVGKAPLSSGGGGLFVCPRFMRDQASSSSLMRTTASQSTQAFASFMSVESGEEALMSVESGDVC